MTPLDFDDYSIPVPEQWKKQLAEAIADTAIAREESFADGHYGRSFIVAAMITKHETNVARLAALCLESSWNESILFAQKYGYLLNKVSK